MAPVFFTDVGAVPVVPGGPVRAANVATAWLVKHPDGNRAPRDGHAVDSSERDPSLPCAPVRVARAA